LLKCLYLILTAEIWQTLDDLRVKLIIIGLTQAKNTFTYGNINTSENLDWAKRRQLDKQFIKVQQTFEESIFGK
jgi:hypothetical protein